MAMQDEGDYVCRWICSIVLQGRILYIVGVRLFNLGAILLERCFFLCSSFFVNAILCILH